MRTGKPFDFRWKPAKKLWPEKQTLRKINKLLAVRDKKPPKVGIGMNQASRSVFCLPHPNPTARTALHP